MQYTYIPPSCFLALSSLECYVKCVLPCIIEPRTGFEPAWAFAVGLQNQSIQPLWYLGILNIFSSWSGWIRTTEVVRRQIYSLLHLTALQRSNLIIFLICSASGSRTHTSLSEQKILSLSCLPFHHRALCQFILEIKFHN